LSPGWYATFFAARYAGKAAAGARPEITGWGAILPSIPAMAAANSPLADRTAAVSPVPPVAVAVRSGLACLLSFPCPVAGEKVLAAGLSHDRAAAISLAKSVPLSVLSCFSCWRSLWPEADLAVGLTSSWALALTWVGEVSGVGRGRSGLSGVAGFA